MNQPEFQDDWLSSYFDGEELTPAEQEAVQQRLATSTESEQLLEDFRSLSGLLKDLPTEAAPAGLAEQIRQQIQQQSLAMPAAPSLQKTETKQRSGKYFWFAGAGTLVAGLLLMTSLYYRIETSETADFIVMNGSPEALEENTTVWVEPKPEHYAGDITLESSHGLEIASASRAGMSTVPSAPLPEMPPTTIPALPPLTAQAQSQLLNELADSPKLQGKLQPGELVRYIETDQDELAVIELSVVDIRKNLGEIEVLLASNGFVTADQQLGRKLMSTDGTEAEVLDQNSPVQPKEPPTKPDTDRKFMETESELFVLLAETNGMLGLYVEGTDQQVLQAINQLNTLEVVKAVNIGSSPALAATNYQMTPVSRQYSAHAFSTHADTNYSINERTLYGVSNDFSYLAPAEPPAEMVVEESVIDENGDSRGLRMRYLNRDKDLSITTEGLSVGESVDGLAESAKSEKLKMGSGKPSASGGEKMERMPEDKFDKPFPGLATDNDSTDIDSTVKDFGDKEIQLAQQMPVLITPIPKTLAAQQTKKPALYSGNKNAPVPGQRENEQTENRAKPEGISLFEAAPEKQMAEQKLAQKEPADSPAIPPQQRTRVLLVLVPSEGKP